MTKTVPLRHLAEINPPSPQFDRLDEDADVLFLPLEAVWSDGRADLSRTVPKRQVQSGYVRFQSGDVVCPKVTPTFQAGRAMAVPAVGAGSTELHVLRPRQDVDARWVRYAVRSKHFLEEGETAFQGVAGLQRVPAEFLANFKVVDVGVGEHRRIADFLDDRVARIDQIIAGRRQQLVSLDDERRAVADDCLTAQDWENSARFGYVIRSIEQGWSPQCDSIPAGIHEWGVLKVSAVKGGAFRENENKLLPPELKPRPEYEIRGGDLLVTRANTPSLVGAFAAVPHGVREKLILCDKIMRISLESTVSAEFASLVGQSRRVRDRLSGAGTGTSGSMVNVRGEDIRDLPMPVLSRGQQDDRVSAWCRSNERIASGGRVIEEQVTLLQEYKQSLITAAVTGELDVTTASSRIPE